ncbi:MBOAT family O-acyltransferase [Magnetovibrio blakemorei]|uniref:Probable alginate O-acetylase AlgI n=1 Tax=Magnetovibrio blakemorei TaxID=28181 RepID=A0A1E5Q616_9PROT|nr:MBOAT family protein [Magnetovibrio blakemorei]OEJ66075.1 hypothetical protein BEN30_13055 [Magnetovibrio blakemorei]OEJ66112.1 hypothetical protein BEN30_12965 [Magnetovibrio blakemorei]
MLFNSPEFLLVFLPIVLVGYYALSFKVHAKLGAGFLVLTSLFFYGWWEPVYLLLIMVSILFNFVMARVITAWPRPSAVAKPLLIVSITANLGTLAFFKYANFFIESFSALSGQSFNSLTIILPLAISFFTFQQIAFLVDVYRNQANEADLLTYSLFVTFFPQLIAGPIVHHGEMMGQFKKAVSRGKPLWDNLAVGLTIIAMGLFKKVILAEKMAFWSDRVFNTAYMGGSPSFIEAWVGVICFTFQIYFDFSGYSDIAIGLARLFGIRLPLNFDSPYKATNIVDFWRRWHITLSRFLRDYIYFPLGGNRKGRIRRYVNLMTVMALGGLWHGAGWTFIMWGVLHGLYLAINHLWWAVTGSRKKYEDRRTGQMYRWFGRAVTLAAVALSWTLFRASSLESALNMYKGLFTLNGVVLPPHYKTILGYWAETASQIGIRFDAVPTYGGGMQIVWIVAVLIIVWFFPSTQELMHKYEPALDFDASRSPKVMGIHFPAWRPSFMLGILCGAVVLSLTIKLLQGQTGEFIYFQF